VDFSFFTLLDFFTVFHTVTADFYETVEMPDADKAMNQQHLGAIRQTSGSGLLRKSAVESRINFG